jgi:PKD repeat protein
MKRTKQFKSVILSGLLVFGIFTHVSYGLDTAMVQADFSYAPSDMEEYQIDFFVIATNVGDVFNFTWDFGDGETYEGDNGYELYDSIPHTFPSAGIYNVCLTVEDFNNKRNSFCENVYVKDFVTIGNEKIHEGSFRIEHTNMDKFTVNFEPSFIDQDGLSYYWDFGDGKSSNEYAPLHTFKDSRKYWVKLMVKDENRIYSTSKLIDIDLDECHTDFDFSFIDSSTIKLVNKSAADIDYHYWVLGDGKRKFDLSLDTLQHTFKKPGIYDIVLFTMDTTETYECVNFKHRQIRIGKVRCNADFSYFVDTITGSNIGVFKANVLGQNPRYNWTFGDGKRYHSPIVTHQFTQSGFNKVRLSVRTNECVNTKEETILIIDEGLDCEADFNYFTYNIGTETILQLTDNSLGQDLSYIWRIGDSTLASTDKQVRFSTENSGRVANVCLTIDNGTYTNTSCKFIYLPRESFVPCKADFTYYVDTLTNEVVLENQSIGIKSIGSQTTLWNFGDGNTSYEKNPTHIYDKKGYYTISLKILCQDKLAFDNEYRYNYRLIDMNTGDNQLKGDFVLQKNPDHPNFKVSGYPVDFVGIAHGDAAKIRWDFEGDGNIDDSTSTTPTYYYPEDTIYTCCYYVEDPVTGIEDQTCRQVDAKSGEFVDEGTGIELVSGGLVSSFSVYPNPLVNGLAVARFTLSTNASVLLTLFDGEGKAVTTLEKGNFPEGEYTSLLNGSRLTKGIYYLQLITNGESTVQKIIVQ